VSNCLTRVQHCTRVKMHVAICNFFCSDRQFKILLFEQIDIVLSFSYLVTELGVNNLDRKIYKNRQRMHSLAQTVPKSHSVRINHA
jgi:hypothetical protein